MKPNPICFTKQKVNFEKEEERDLEKKGTGKIPIQTYCCVFLLFNCSLLFSFFNFACKGCLFSFCLLCITVSLQDVFYSITCHLYQNPINDKHVYKNNYPLTRLSFVSKIVIFRWSVLYLLNFNTTNLVLFYTKYLFATPHLLLSWQLA